MFGKRAADLVKELVSAGPDALPPYNVSRRSKNVQRRAEFVLL